MQCDSNGGLSILENHLSEIETSEAKNLPEHSMERIKEHVSYDFNDDEVTCNSFTSLCVYNISSIL